MSANNESRRRFLRQALCATAGTAAFSGLMGKLQIAQAAVMAQSCISDYRALVCIFLNGGNDGFNMVVPRDARHVAYASQRGSLAIPQASLLPLNLLEPAQDGGSYGLHPQMTGVRDLFNAGQAAVVANVGPLLRPITKAAYRSGSTPAPAQLFSHSDQALLWQAPQANVQGRVGWAGRLADLFASGMAGAPLPMNISLAGSNVLQSSLTSSPYYLAPEGIERIDPIHTGGTNCSGSQAWNAARCNTFNRMMQLQQGHVFERAYASRMRETLASAGVVESALAGVPLNDPIYRPFWDLLGIGYQPGSINSLPGLAAQLLTAARVIRARSQLGAQRQIFFVSLDGFDTHTGQAAQHGPLLRLLSQSVKAFFDVLAHPSVGMAQRVTAFTASDFGRTTTINSSTSTDHGWGNHHLVFGGGVRGGRIYGRWPQIGASSSNPDDAGWGQIIPTLSVDQYASTLSKWFGLCDVDRATVFPNLVHMQGAPLSISGADLGFMNA